MRSLNIAATGMQAQQKNIDVISNNIANLGTTAYKQQRAEFVDLLYQNETRMGSNSAADGTIIPTGAQFGLGTKLGSIYRVNTQGNLQETGNTFDVAMNGRGYFQVNLPSGEIGYTRDGQFQVSEEGILVNSLGYEVAPGITIPDDAQTIDVNAEGEVIASFDGQAESQVLGQIEVATFINEAGLNAIGNNIHLETEASGAPLLDFPGAEGYGTVLQGFIEGSNVDSVTEITKLIEAQRAYELNSRIISASDEMLQSVNNIR